MEIRVEKVLILIKVSRNKAEINLKDIKKALPVHSKA